MILKFESKSYSNTPRSLDSAKVWTLFSQTIIQKYFVTNWEKLQMYVFNANFNGWFYAIFYCYCQLFIRRRVNGFVYLVIYLLTYFFYLFIYLIIYLDNLFQNFKKCSIHIYIKITIQTGQLKSTIKYYKNIKSNIIKTQRIKKGKTGLQCIIK